MAAKWTKTIVGVTLMTGIAGSAGALDLFCPGGSCHSILSHRVVVQVWTGTLWWQPTIN
jgi:hypothetical protein